MNFLYVAMAGAIGAPLRYLVDAWAHRHFGGDFPMGTFLINVSGSLSLGLIAGAALYHGLPDTPKLVLGVGFCGAYTTFSTFTFETVRLHQEGETLVAGRNAIGSLAAGVAAAAAGLAVMAAL